MDFWTADWHFDHNNILTYCSRTDFMDKRELNEYKEAKKLDLKGIRSRVNYSGDTKERMNAAIIAGCNAVVGENDTIWHGGDVIFGGKDPDRLYNRLLELRSQIVCRNIVLIWGNHDESLQWWNNRSITEDRKRMGFAPYTPWSFTELEKYMETKSGEWVDHHKKMPNPAQIQ